MGVRGRRIEERKDAARFVERRQNNPIRRPRRRHADCFAFTPSDAARAMRPGSWVAACLARPCDPRGSPSHWQHNTLSRHTSWRGDVPFRPNRSAVGGGPRRPENPPRPKTGVVRSSRAPRRDSVLSVQGPPPVQLTIRIAPRPSCSRKWSRSPYACRSGASRRPSRQAEIILLPPRYCGCPTNRLHPSWVYVCTGPKGTGSLKITERSVSAEHRLPPGRPEVVRRISRSSPELLQKDSRPDRPRSASSGRVSGRIAVRGGAPRSVPHAPFGRVASR